MTKQTVIAAIVYAIFALGANAADNLDSRAVELLSQAKAVTGGAAWDKIGNVQESGNLVIPQLQGLYSQQADLQHPQYAVHYDLGALKGAEGWDGHQAWSVDASGVAQITTAKDDRAMAVSTLYCLAMSYWYPERMAAKRAYAGERQAGDQRFDAVRIDPAEGTPFELWINRSTHRIERKVSLAGGGPDTEIYEDFRTVNGVSLPFTIRDLMAGHEQQRIALERVTFDAPVADNTFSPPAPPPVDYAFPAGQDHVTAPFHLVENHIDMKVAIDGGAPLDMLFDTGALNIVDSAIAKRHGLKTDGAMQVGGFGKDTSAFGFTRVQSMNIEGFTVAKQSFLSGSLAALQRATGTPFDGLIGYEVAKRVVVQIDYPAQRLTLIDHKAFVPPANAVKVLLKFAGRIPVFDAKVDGVAGEFQLDTGSRNGLWLTESFATATDAAVRHKASEPFVAGLGVGGPVHVRLARANTLEIGSIKIQHPRMLLASERSGTEGAGQTSGNIGGAILKHFVVTLDYTDSCMYLVPAADNYDDADEFDRSGLFLLRPEQGDGVEVFDVAAGSAAASAGLNTGDRILSVDGKTTGMLGLMAIRERFMAKPGTAIVLKLQDKAGVSRIATLVLQNRA